jgi:hypothetical protein
VQICKASSIYGPPRSGFCAGGRNAIVSGNHETAQGEKQNCGVYAVNRGEVSLRH